MAIIWNNQSFSLSAEYEQFNGRYLFRRITLLEKKETSQISVEIPLNSIWLNGLPADDLKWFRSSKIPEGWALDEGGDVYKLSHKDKRWEDWHKKCRSVKVEIWFKGEMVKMLPTLISCLRMLGLKKVVKEANPKSQTPYKEYIVFHDGDRVPDHYTLGQLDLSHHPKIEIIPQADLTPVPSPLQKATFGEYKPTHFLADWFSKIQEKIGIVCLIEGEKDFGTGFLIGRNLIMTNRHNLPNSKDLKYTDAVTLEGHKATFFFEEGKKPLHVSLKKIVAYSPRSAPPFHQHSVEALDYAIVSFTLDQSESRAHELEREMDIAHEFFEEARKEADDIRSQKKTKSVEKRANIIQHPGIGETNNKVPMMKQIAFRENRIHDTHTCLLHYKSETQEGSSGSPIISDRGKFLGLHVSECLDLENILFIRREQLFEKLDLGKGVLDEDMYSSFPQDPLLRVYYKGKNKGFCAYPHEKEGLIKFRFLDLIKEKMKLQNNLEAGLWAIHFLREKYQYSLTIEHVYCNVAIPAQQIFNHLHNNNKFEALAKEQEECKKEEQIERERIEEKNRLERDKQEANRKAEIRAAKERADRKNESEQTIANKCFWGCIGILKRSFTGILKVTLKYPIVSVPLVLALFAWLSRLKRNQTIT